MAALQKVEKFEFDGFKKLLICSECKNPPTPKTTIYSCTNTGKKCDYIECDGCFATGLCECGCRLSEDSILTQLVSFIKFYNCCYLKNGCQEELEAKDLEDHEEICIFRTVDCPKVGCDEWIALNGIMDHFKEEHSDFVMKDNVLEFKGSVEDLEKSTFIMNCYGKPFYPQFQVHEKLLHFWVVGHGNQDESIHLRYFDISFFSLHFLILVILCLLKCLILGHG